MGGEEMQIIMLSYVQKNFGSEGQLWESEV